MGDATTDFFHKFVKHPILPHEEIVRLFTKRDQLREVFNHVGNELLPGFQNEGRMEVETFLEPLLDHQNDLDGKSWVLFWMSREQMRAIEDRVAIHNMRLVVNIATKHHHAAAHMELLDLFNEGVFGLYRAIDLFDHSRGYQFSTYAVAWIRQKISRGGRKQERLIHVPVHAQNLLTRETTGGLLTDKQQQSKTLRDTKIAMQRLVELDRPINGDGDLTPIGCLGVEPKQIKDTQLLSVRKVLAQAERSGRISHQEAKVVASRYGFDGRGEKTFVEVGCELGFSHQHARRVLTKAERKIRQILIQSGYQSDLEA